MKRCLFLFIFLIVSFCVNKLAAQNLPQPGKKPVKEVVAVITIEEKSKLADKAITDAGDKVKTGISSTDTRLSAIFNLPEIVVEKVIKALVSKAVVNELKKQNALSETGYIEDLNSFAAIGH